MTETLGSRHHFLFSWHDKRLPTTVMPISPLSIGAISKFATIIGGIKRSDLLLIGFIAAIVLLIGILSGYVDVPIQVEAMEHHEEIIEAQRDAGVILQKILRVEQLQLYFQQEACLDRATGPVEVARCNREDIDDAIKGI